MSFGEYEKNISDTRRNQGNSVKSYGVDSRSIIF